MVGILGANSVSGGYEIDNSLRLNRGDNPQLNLVLIYKNQLLEETEEHLHFLFGLNFKQVQQVKEYY